MVFKENNNIQMKIMLLYYVAKCEWLAWKTESGIEVKNLEGSSSRDSEWYVNGNKKQAYEWITGEKFGKCSNKFCFDDACDTAHVIVKGSGRVGLVPLCKSCNNPYKRFWFKLRIGSLIVPLLRVLTPHPNSCVYNPRNDKDFGFADNPQTNILYLKKRIYT
jgi:hypothetical protein